MWTVFLGNGVQSHATVNRFGRGSARTLCGRSTSNAVAWGHGNEPGCKLCFKWTQRMVKEGE